MLRSEMTHAEQIFVDYGYVAGEAHGYEKGWNDSQKLACRDKKICTFAGVALGIIVGELIEEAVDAWEDHDITEKAKNWAAEKREAIKNKFSRKNKRKH